MAGMHLLACQPTPPPPPPICISSCFCLFFNNWLKRLVSKPQNMILLSKWQNATQQTRKHRNPSCTAIVTSPRLLLHTKTCPRSTCYRLEFNTSQKKTRALKMHLSQPGCYGHVIGEIHLVCKTDILDYQNLSMAQGYTV